MYGRYTRFLQCESLQTYVAGALFAGIGVILLCYFSIRLLTGTLEGDDVEGALLLSWILGFVSFLIVLFANGTSGKPRTQFLYALLFTLGICAIIGLIGAALLSDWHVFIPIAGLTAVPLVALITVAFLLAALGRRIYINLRLIWRDWIRAWKELAAGASKIA